MLSSHCCKTVRYDRQSQRRVSSQHTSEVSLGCPQEPNRNAPETHGDRPLKIAPLGPHPGARRHPPGPRLLVEPVATASPTCSQSEAFIHGPRRCHPGVIPEQSQTHSNSPAPPPLHDHSTRDPSLYLHGPQDGIPLVYENRERPSSRRQVSSTVRDTSPGLRCDPAVSTDGSASHPRRL